MLRKMFVGAFCDQTEKYRGLVAERSWRLGLV